MGQGELNALFYDYLNYVFTYFDSVPIAYAISSVLFNPVITHNHFELLQKILGLITIKYTNYNDLLFISSSIDYIFQLAAEFGKLDTMNLLLEFAANPKFNMAAKIVKDNFEKAFTNAAANGHLDIINRLLQLSNEAYIDQTTLAPIFNSAFVAAERYNHINVMNKLLTIQSCIHYAFENADKYPKITERMIRNKMEDLHIRSLQNNMSSKDAFDINDPNETMLAYFILNSFIKQNSRVLDDDLRFLLFIPAVKALVQADVIVLPNSLCKAIALAIKSSNQTAAKMLLHAIGTKKISSVNVNSHEAAKVIITSDPVVEVKPDDPSQILTETDKQDILDHFNKGGKITTKEMALILATQSNAKDKTTFIIKRNQVIAFHLLLYKLINEPTLDAIHRLQFVFTDEAHTDFGEVLIDKTSNPIQIS